MTFSWPLLIRRVHGHSMVPVLPPGTLVVGWRWFRSLKSDNVVVLRYDGRELIKRIESMHADKLFLLGDHAETSTDSRHFGMVPRADVLAKVIIPGTRRPKV